ncbi:hypothetical protein [Lacticaseibacillus saniviri]|uniref:Uncharacterized protein n=1 Tax=Lacticaseibacillus saniviri JCM 17471 = DSM 24301 TaxID=1293598 RepID=A0A0R2N0A4_9LACO|nr:hypothetical protein [Lacticaseibacillus saniviri]KRO17421.1 hypothetical protein IV56_GL000337 [Lacticaseibacillus saniviri JCM 17471 = DSM 24301]
MKTVYTIYQQPQPNGAYFYVADYADDYPTDYPQTEVAIPDEIKDGLPKFSWSDNAWHDVSDEGQAKLLSDLQKANTQLQTQNVALTKQLAEVTQSASEATEKAGKLQTQIVALTQQVAQLMAPNAQETEGK